jgi:hypothetical protein
MTRSMTKHALILILVALALMVLVAPIINAAIVAMKEAQFQADAEHIMLVLSLRAELRNNTNRDPYDTR